ncbi:hypothetical protein GURKE_00050 [Brevundimonas phage vB_BpoS-Gurke]|uniref:Uncharacterized protein n=1 Tax=Brevundimonas phage vB_BpoS-Gurke TaxID=2948599 RepID=A0A9E7SQF4_9CAUD|nr:hypothetical protein GURKE_00050 [Brevundimonas phage vB_BpoS-Gurke]
MKHYTFTARIGISRNHDSDTAWACLHLQGDVESRMEKARVVGVVQDVALTVTIRFTVTALTLARAEFQANAVAKTYGQVLSIKRERV